MTNNNLNNWYVKFVPLNEYTYSSLINKTVKFSSVYDFNDFNEEGIFVTNSKIGWESGCKKIRTFLSKYLSNKTNISKVAAAALHNSSYTSDYKNHLINELNMGGVEYAIERHYSALIEIITYLEIGILCLSRVDVFKDDAAQLMFAHYANNLKGLALIYKAKNAKILHEVEYKNHIFLDTRNEDDLLNLVQGKEVEEFLFKSPSWSYEKECRIFGKQNIQKAIDHDLTLRGIFYTSKQSVATSESLKEINKKLYKNELFIEELHRSYSEERMFTMCRDEVSSFPSTMEYLEGIINSEA
jgi:hypothetical protein